MTTGNGNPPEKPDRFKKFLQEWVVLPTAVVVFIATIFLANWDISGYLKAIVIGVGVASFLLALTFVLRYIYPQNQFVANILGALNWAGKFLIILLAITFTLSPLLLLDEPNRTFILKIEGIIALSITRLALPSICSCERQDHTRRVHFKPASSTP